MGSGCNKNKTGSKCFQRVSDCCVTYTGPEIPLLGICTGDELCEVMAVILEQLDKAMKGVDLTLLDLNCEFIKSQMVGKNKDLFTLLQVMIDSHCTLKQLVDSINTQLGQAITFDLKCIVPTAPGVPGTVQGLINAVCKMQSDMTAMQSQLNGLNNISGTIDNRAGNMILGAINSCGGYGLTKTGSASTANIVISGMVPPMSPIPCFAALSNFSSTGVGLPNSAFCGWYICNGANGTPDMRGYAFAGATSLPGIVAPNNLDQRVDPTVQGAPYTSSILGKSGEVKHILTVSEIPSHAHAFSIPPHSHNITVSSPTGTSGGGLWNAGGVDTVINPQTRATTSTNAQPSTSSSVGESQAHNNIQPTIYGYWIMRLA